MAGTLFIVGTPIGNLSDLTPRAAETLAAVDFIAAEDTRVTMKLLNHLELHKPLVSYYKHNAVESGARIIERLQAGESCALVTDAGMPAISDPGEPLVAACGEAGIDVKVVPGPSAVVSAVALSGLDTGRFTFEGFLSVTKKNRVAHLESLKAEPRTMVFYEAPHKLCNTLSDLLKYLGDRKIVICREMTKLFEETLRMTLSEAVAYYETVTPKGEFVLVVAGAPAQEKTGTDMESALERVDELMENGLSRKDAVRQTAEETGLSRNALYDAAIKKD